MKKKSNMYSLLRETKKKNIKSLFRTITFISVIIFFSILPCLVFAANNFSTLKTLTSSKLIITNYPPTIGAITPSSGYSIPNQAVNFTTTFSDPNGWQNVQYVYLLINTSTGGANCFYGYYNQNTNKLYLMNNTNTAWIGGFSPGTPKVIENSYAKLNCFSTTVSGSDKTITIKWSVTFKPAFTGQKNSYLYVKDDADAYAGFTQKGAWTIDGTAPIGKITINNGAAYTNLTQLNLSLSATDTQSGISQMQFSLDNTTWSTPQAYATTRTWTLFSTGNGTKTIYVKYKDGAGNWSTPVSDTIILDTTVPAGTIVINNNAAYTISSQITLTLWGTDSFSGISKMKFSNDNVNWSAEETYATTKTWTLSSGDGTKTVYVKYKDGAGNWSTAFSDTIILDTAAPTGTIVINSNAAYTNLTQVTLTLSATDSLSGISKMKFSNDPPQAGNWSTEEAYATTKTWTLSTGNGMKTVYAKYKDNAGTWSTVSISDTILFDTTPPTGAISINNGAASTITTSVTLNLSATDALSGVSKMKFSNDNSTWSAEENYATTKTWTLSSGSGEKKVYVKYKDGAGNWSAAGADSINYTPDTTPPTGAITINNNAQYTNSTSVTLALSATDTQSGVSQMQFSNDNVNWSAEETYATTKTWTLSTGEGTKTVYVKYKDNAGNWSNAFSDTIILDTTVPTGTIVINSNTTYTTLTQVTLTLSATDSLSAVSQMKFSNDNVNWSAEETYATTKTWTLSSGDGTKTVYAKYKDNAGTWSTVSVSDTILLDTTPPTGTISINNGAASTTTTSVTLNLSATDVLSGVSKMKFSNDNSSWSAEENYAVTKTWTLSNGTGAKIVYISYKDGAGNWSAAVSDTINYMSDTTPPTGTISINNGASAVNTTAVTLNISASDAESGVAQMQFSNDNTAWSTAEVYAATKNWTLSSGEGTKTVYVKYKDNAGNWSNAFSDTIILDTTAPTGTIVINSNTAYTTSTQVTLTLSATDTLSGVSQMQFSNDSPQAGNWSTPEAYATTKTWTLSTGDGTKTVYVKYKDGAGNWSTPVSDTIILDTAAPTGTIVINSNAAYTNLTQVTLTLSATDSLSGVSKMKFSNDNINWSTEETYAITKAWTLATGDGTKTVYAKYKNGAGLWSSAYSDNIILETTPPTGSITINDNSTYTSTTRVTLTLSATDQESGVTQMQFSNDNTNWSTPESYSTTKSWTLTTGDGTKTVYVKYKNGAGLWSSAYSDNIILETTPPTGSITINDNSTYTSTTQVTLTLSATDPESGVTQMQFSNDNTNWSTPETYSTTKAWTLSTGDGTKTVYVKYKNGAGLWSSAFSDNIILDTILPEIQITTPPNNCLTNQTQIDVSGTSNELNLNVITINDIIATIEGNNFTVVGIPLNNEGNNPIIAIATDLAGNENSHQINIIRDTVPPQDLNVSIDEGEYTNNTTIHLTLSVLDAAEMIISESLDFTGAEWEPYVSAKLVILSSGDGTKTIYAKYRDLAGNETQPVSDTIILDTTLPLVQITSPENNYTTDQTEISVSGAFTEQNINTITVNGISATIEASNFTVSGVPLDNEGDNPIIAIITDFARNQVSHQINIIRDTDSSMNPCITIDEGDYTNNSIVHLTLYADNASEVVLSENQYLNKAVWEPYSESKAWVLSGGNGLKTIYARFKDIYGNISEIAQDTVTLNQEGPYITIEEGEYSNHSVVKVVLHAEGVAEVMLSENSDFSGAAWEPYEETKLFTLSNTSGRKVIYAKFR